MFDLLFTWHFFWPYLIKSIIAALIIAGVGLLIGKLSWHEPEDFE